MGKWTRIYDTRGNGFGTLKEMRSGLERAR
jgi:hypothetical protein